MLLVVRLVNCHVIGCKTRNSWLVRFDPFFVPVSPLLVKLSLNRCQQLPAPYKRLINDTKTDKQ